MSPFEKAIESCKRLMKKQKIACDDKLLTSIAKSLGPALYSADAKLVAASDKSELATIKKKFLIGKLKQKDGPALDKAISSAVSKIGKSNSYKLRAVFYYLLVKGLKKESVFQ